jgi:hypothetical protein
MGGLGTSSGNRAIRVRERSVFDPPGRSYSDSDFSGEHEGTLP